MTTSEPAPPLPPVEQASVAFPPVADVVPDHKAAAVAWLTALARGEAVPGCAHTEPEDS